MIFFVEIGGLMLKVMQKYQGPRIDKIILKKLKTRGLTLTYFKTY